MKKIHSLLNSSFLISALFICGISLPGLIWLVSDTKDISEQEKRRLAPLPEISFDKNLLAEYPKNFDKYFNDHYGLRTELVDLNRFWQATVFNKSSVRRVIRGEQGWLFFDAQASLYDHVGLIKLTENVLPAWKQHLVNKKTWLNSLGIEYLFVPVPNKMTLFPEYLPYRIRKYAGSTMLEKLLVKLKSGQPYRNFVDLKSVLTAQKNTSREKLQNSLSGNNADTNYSNIRADNLYFYRDSHWTTLGAFLSYQHIVQQLKTHISGLEPPIRFDQLDPILVDKKGDLARMGSINKTETHHRLTVIDPCSPEEPEIVTSFKETEAYKLKKKTLPIKRGCKNKTVRAVVVNDSFGAYLQPFFAESFKEVVFMRSYDLVGMESFLREFQPDIYIDIRSERSVKLLLAPNKRLQTALETLKLTSRAIEK